MVKVGRIMDDDKLAKGLKELVKYQDQMKDDLSEALCRKAQRFDTAARRHATTSAIARKIAGVHASIAEIDIGSTRGSLRALNDKTLAALEGHTTQLLQWFQEFLFIIDAEVRRRQSAETQQTQQAQESSTPPLPNWISTSSVTQTLGITRWELDRLVNAGEMKTADGHILICPNTGDIVNAIDSDSYEAFIERLGPTSEAETWSEKRAMVRRLARGLPASEDGRLGRLAKNKFAKLRREHRESLPEAAS
jgi:hypothetical protein